MIAKLLFKCPECGAAVEDEGPCVECWDRLVENDVRISKNARRRRERRDIEMLEEHRRGISTQALAEKYGISVRSVLRALQLSRQRERAHA